jgi:hypothetical protein
MNASTAKRFKAKLSHSTRKHPESLLSQLGIIGLDSVEPAILGALIGGEPLLLIGLHGTGKSYLLNRISAGLGLEWRHSRHFFRSSAVRLGTPRGISAEGSTGESGTQLWSRMLMEREHREIGDRSRRLRRRQRSNGLGLDRSGDRQS